MVSHNDGVTRKTGTIPQGMSAYSDKSEPAAFAGLLIRQLKRLDSWLNGMVFGMFLPSFDNNVAS
jgi:hypothetical protein